MRACVCVRVCAYSMRVALRRALMSFYFAAALFDLHLKAKHRGHSTRAAITTERGSLRMRAHICAHIYARMRAYIYIYLCVPLPPSHAPLGVQARAARRVRGDGVPRRQRVGALPAALHRSSRQHRSRANEQEPFEYSCSTPVSTPAAVPLQYPCEYPCSTPRVWAVPLCIPEAAYGSPPPAVGGCRWTHIWRKTGDAGVYI